MKLCRMKWGTGKLFVIDVSFIGSGEKVRNKWGCKEDREGRRGVGIEKGGKEWREIPVSSIHELKSSWQSSITQKTKPSAKNTHPMPQTPKNTEEGREAVNSERDSKEYLQNPKTTPKTTLNLSKLLSGVV